MWPPKNIETTLTDDILFDNMGAIHARNGTGPYAIEAPTKKEVQPFSQAEMDALARNIDRDFTSGYSLSRTLIRVAIWSLIVLPLVGLAYNYFNPSTSGIIALMVCVPFWWVLTRFIIKKAFPLKSPVEEGSSYSPKVVCSVSGARGWLNSVEADTALSKVATTLSTQLDLMEKLMPGQEKTAAHSAATDLLETDLPKLIEFYQNVPEELRASDYLGQSPEAMLQAGLAKVSQKAAEVINQLKCGPLDNLAVHTRYLENAHGTGETFTTA